MRIRQTLVAAAAVIAAPAYAAIASGTSGDGELFLAVFDDKVSYTLDLGVRQTAFFNAAQADLGYTRSWNLSGDYWKSFLGQADVKALQWAVVASETTGGTAAGGVRLFTTVKSGQESKVGDTTNQGLLNGIGSTQLGTFYAAVNSTGTHPPSNDFTVNGNSTNLKSDGNAYYGPRELPGFNTPTLNGNTPFSSANAVGEDSYFYFLTRSGTVQNNKVTVDQFGNASFAGTFLLANGGVGDTLSRTDGSGYTLTYNLQPVPEPGTYALMLLGLGGLAAAARRRRAR